MCLISAKCIQKVNLSSCVLVLSDSQLVRHCSEDSLCATFIFLLWLHTALFASCWAAGGAASPWSSIPLEPLITGTHYLSPLDPEGHKHTRWQKKKKTENNYVFKKEFKCFVFFRFCLRSQQQSLIPPPPCLTQKYEVRRLVANCRKNIIPKMWESCDPLLTFILQPLEYPSPAASPLVQLFVDLLKHLLHLPWRCLVELLWDRKTERDRNTGRWVSLPSVMIPQLYDWKLLMCPFIRYWKHFDT